MGSNPTVGTNLARSSMVERQALPDSSIGRASPFGGECSPFESESGNQIKIVRSI